MDHQEAIMWRTVAIALLRRIGGHAVIEPHEMSETPYAYRLLSDTNQIEVELQVSKQ